VTLRFIYLPGPIRCQVRQPNVWRPQIATTNESLFGLIADAALWAAPRASWPAMHVIEATSFEPQATINRALIRFDPLQRSYSGSDLKRDGTRRPFDFMLPKTEYGPTLPSQRTSNSFVARAISLNLVSPECDVRAWKVFAIRAPVPKAAIDEDGDLAARPCEIGFARNLPMFSVAAQSFGPKEFAEGQLSSGIASRADGGHDFGPHFL
jgi:hypothetical protein